MIFDAIVLAGGRASRLGGIDKTALEVDGRSLLDLVVDATAGAHSVIVVGSAPASARYDVVQEQPAFGGPAAALNSGLQRLATAAATDATDTADATARDDHPAAPGEGDGVVLVLAGDLPRVGPAVPMLLDRMRESGPDVDGVIAVDPDGRAQYLTSVFRVGALRHALDGVVANDSMRGVVGALRLDEVAVPAETTHDVDTWHDAELLGISRKAAPVNQNAPAESHSPYPELAEWNASLSSALAIPPADVEKILALAGVAAHRVIRPAAPVTTFLVGYAAGALVAGGMDPDEAFRRATATADELLAGHPSADTA